MRFDSITEKVNHIEDTAIVNPTDEDDAIYVCPDCGETFGNPWDAAECCVEQTEYDERFDALVDIRYEEHMDRIGRS